MKFTNWTDKDYIELGRRIEAAGPPETVEIGPIVDALDAEIQDRN